MAQATTYAVHTEACTYLLDDDGICCRILSPGGLVTPGMSAAVGAQFVACLDLNVAGGLVAELRVGSAALFATKDEQGRYMLLRTSPIRHIEARQSTQPLLSLPVIAASLPPRARPSSNRPPKGPPKSGKVAKNGGAGPPQPRPPSPVLLRGNEATGPSLSEQTLSIAKPLFRPQAPPAPDRPRAPPIPAPRSIAGPAPTPTPAATPKGRSNPPPRPRPPATPAAAPTPPALPRPSAPPPRPPAPPVPRPAMPAPRPAAPAPRPAAPAPPVPRPAPAPPRSGGPPDIPSTPPRSRRTDPARRKR